MKISIQGNKGSYSHIATDNYVQGDYELLERGSFDEVFDDLDSNKADLIIVPIENSTYGSIYTNYDNLTNYKFPIIGEIYLKINFHLAVLPQTKFEEITEAYIHPVAMGQIGSFIKENPQITFKEFEDTAGALKMIRDKKLAGAAGAASKFAAELYGMDVLKENIQENKKNYTRFYVLSKNRSESENQNKTTLSFTLGEEAGSLYKTLRSFADRNISLSKIESRPIMNTDWKYRFYIDANAPKQSEAMQNALNELRSYVREVSILGSYQKGVYIDT